MKHEEHTVLIFQKSVPRLKLPSGVVGVVVHVYGSNAAYEVELFVDDGKTIGVETFAAAELALFTIACEQESDGSYLATTPELPGVFFRGETDTEATAKANRVVMRVFADQMYGEQSSPDALEVRLANKEDISALAGQT